MKRFIKLIIALYRANPELMREIKSALAFIIFFIVMIIVWIILDFKN